MTENFFKDTIVAISTPPGNGGVGIVRISGPEDTIQHLKGKLFGDTVIEDHKAKLLPIYDENKSLVDRAIVLYFKNPRSFTGESVLEIQAHGGSVLLNWIVEIILKAGKEKDVRLAKPGEFSERAFLNGKIDLVQAEAIADLIEASSRSAIKAASRSLRGDFSKKINLLSERLINLRIQVEAILDFPEEEIEFLQDYKIKSQFEELIKDIEEIKKISKQGELLRDGVKVALIGNTNVGKSSLMNTLAGDEIAIVTDIEGTTRDKIQTQISLNNLLFTLVDTAGIRETEDKVEKIGIERAKKEISSADIILKVIDSTKPEESLNNKELDASLALANENAKVINIYNKADLLEEIPKNVSRETSQDIYISTKNGYGLEELKNTLIELAGWENVESVYLARERHLVSLEKTLESLNCAKEFLEQNQPLEFFAEELRNANNKLGEICGNISSDDLLGKIFSGFCIGK